ncbi:hypothetical protein GQ602_001442 [Ophiocordyceps camponoti-floridani]|uniref:Uncharacterized protein n=1 Tax=Ophiocordyceps camponoti-floridani TaxID=2030778 RepID=A0A8H4VH84_9HYPO|nr:hypothetical protein GQ602_001442 [Ophiocordyceps camponoti-floridani]
MSRPPSPVSSCPLRRLQVRVGPDTSVYQASQFVGGMALTLDGQPSTATGRYCLMLVVRCAQRNMLSIRLSELLQHPQGPADSISVDGDALQLTIKVPSQRHEIRVAFEHGRDFSLSVCMLNSSLTSGLLEQFQADVSRGCDEGLCAQFYLERLQSHRREFWLSRLMGSDAQETAALAPNQNAAV